MLYRQNNCWENCSWYPINYCPSLCKVCVNVTMCNLEWHSNGNFVLLFWFDLITLKTVRTYFTLVVGFTHSYFTSSPNLKDVIFWDTCQCTLEHTSKPVVKVIQLIRAIFTAMSGTWREIQMQLYHLLASSSELSDIGWSFCSFAVSTLIQSMSMV